MKGSKVNFRCDYSLTEEQLKEKKALVSIVIPTYNRSFLLERAIKSVLAQTYQDIELIIVDDNSTDNTQDVVLKFQDSRIHYIRHSKNKGPSAACNSGIKKSSGEFIGFLDDDDEYLPDKIERTLKIFHSSKKKLGVVCSNFWRVDGEKKKIGLSNQSPFLRFWIFSKKVFEKIGFFDEKIEIYEDLEFDARTVCNFDSYFIKEPLAIYHETKGGLSSSFSDIKRLIEVKKLVLRRYESDLRKSKHRTAIRKIARIDYYLAKDLLKIQKIQEGRKYFLKAFFTYPLKVEYFGKFVKSYLKIKPTRKKKIFIEFFGFARSGKTTACNKLADRLKKEGASVALKKEFPQYKTFFQSLLPFILFPQKTLRSFIFSFKNKNLIYYPYSDASPLKQAYKVFKRLATVYSMFAKGDFQYFLTDNHVLFSIIFSNPKGNPSFLEIFDLYPGDKIYIIFVDTPLMVADERIKKRKADRGERFSKEMPSKKKKKHDQQKSSRPKDLYFLLKKYEGSHKINKVIAIDGTKPIEASLDFIRSSLEA